MFPLLQQQLYQQKLLALTTREDVIALLGEAQDDEYYTYYDVEFLEENFKIYFYYKDNQLDFWRLFYVYPGMNKAENLTSAENYEITFEDRASANAVPLSVSKVFIEKLTN